LDNVPLVALMLGVVLAGAVSSAANGTRPRMPRTLSPLQHVDEFDTTQHARGQPDPLLSINDVRLEKPRSDALTRSLLLLKFNLLNESESPVADLLIEVAIVEKSSEPDDQTLTRAVAGPFTVQGHVIVEPGDALQFEMLFRNVSPECACAATVRVVSARALMDLKH